MTERLNLFPVSNQKQLSLSYRLMGFGNIPETQSFYANLLKARRYINQEYGTPAVLTMRDGKHYLAVASATKKEGGIPEHLEISGIQAITINVHLQDPIYTIPLAAIDNKDIHLVEDFISFELRSAFRDHQELWRGASPFIYYTKQAVPLKTDRHICLYSGFRYRIRVIDGQIYLAIDITHVSIDTRTLTERIIQGEEWRHLQGRHFLYEFGSLWYFIQLQEVSHSTVSEAKFEHPEEPGVNISVYDYTRKKWESHPAVQKLVPDSSALVYNNPGQNDQRYGATMLARLRYNSSETEQSHTETILEPDDRLKRQMNIIATYCDGQFQINGQKIRISQEAKAIEAKTFSVPAFKFGNEIVLRTDGNLRDGLQNMLSLRKKWLQSKQIGPFASLPASMGQFILAPVSIAADEDLMERLREDISQAVNSISSQEYDPTVVVWDDRRAKTIPQIKRELKQYKQQMDASGGMACALVILPDTYSHGDTGNLRRHIKTMLYPVRTKCILASEITSYLRRTPNGYEVKNNIYRSYLFNTVLKLLVISGAKPWILADQLHYDLYIGIDVLNNTAGFSFLSAGGELLQFRSFTSGDQEKLSAAEIAKVFLDDLPRFIERTKTITGTLPRHIIIHRDGRSYDSELEGLQHVVNELKANKLLMPDAQSGVVEIHKSNSASLRMFYWKNGRAFNPKVGRYHIFDSQWGIVATTGYPDINQGTAAPLVAQIAYGDLEIKKVLQDIFNLSMLAWTKPDGVQSSPLTIKVIDDWLEPIGADVDKNEGLLDELETADSSITFGKKLS
jgi:hypothetical protein